MKTLTGYTLRSDRYRLVSWRDHRNLGAAPIFTELFDHKDDPTETVNVAADHPELVERLKTLADEMSLIWVRLARWAPERVPRRWWKTRFL